MSLNRNRSGGWGGGLTDWMLGQQLHEPEGQGRRSGAQRGVRGRDMEPEKEGRVRASDRGLHGPAEALLIHGGVELTGERTAPPLMMAAKAGRRWCRLACALALFDGLVEGEGARGGQ